MRLARDQIERLVSIVDSNWVVERVEPADSGELAVVHCEVTTDTGRRSCVLKANDLDGGRGIPLEARVTALLADRTTVPVPKPLGVIDGPDSAASAGSSDPDDAPVTDDSPVSDDSLPVPALLSRELPGVPFQRSALAELSDATLESVARQVGAALAQVHAVDAVSSFGFLSVADDRRIGSRPPADPETLTIEEPSGWPARLAADADRELASLRESRFADLADRVAPALRAAVDSVQGPFRPALAHVDASLENHCWDGDRREVTGLLDWAFTIAAPPSYDLVVCAGLLGGGHWSLVPDNPDRTSLVWDALRAGYRNVDRSGRSPTARLASSSVERRPASG